MKNTAKWGLIPLLMLALTVTFAGPSRTDVQLNLELAKPVVLASTPQTAYLKVGIIGSAEDLEKNRAPVNMAIVLDRSGSMQGEKIMHARQAAEMLINRLSPNDIVALVTYSDTVMVDIPATKLTDRTDLRNRIRAIQAGGSTALFAGVSKGAAEVRKFHSPDRVNRVILLSDGLANVGPSSPEMLAELGASLGAEGIAVSTIGLGLDYNEDLMYQLAAKSDGAPAFAEKPGDLAKFFDREVRAATNVIASNLEISVELTPGFRPVRVLGDRGEVHGQTVSLSLNQIYNEWENYFIIEVDLPKLNPGGEVLVAQADLHFRDQLAGETRHVKANAKVVATTEMETVDRATNEEVTAQAVRLIATERNERAVALRDEGKTDAARELLMLNSNFLATNAAQLPSQSADLMELQQQNIQDSQSLDEESWNRQRKVMKERSQGDLWQIKQ